MRKVTVLNRVTVDGFFAGPKGEFDWFVHDPEVDKEAFEKKTIGTPDTVLFGRTTYEMFEGYWPLVAKGESPMGVNTPEERHVADLLANMTKVVVSSKPRDFTWENSEMLEGELVEGVKKLKEQSGGDIIIFGSGTIIQQLANAGLIDDYWLILTPVVLGQGKPLFKDVSRFNLKLKSAKSFDSGNVLLHYQTTAARA